MDIDPLKIIEEDEPQAEDKVKQQQSKNQLNTAVAISIALLATFMGVCKIKDDNIVQAMQQAQAGRVDDWALYQARNIRSEIAKATADQLKLQALSQSDKSRAAYDQKIRTYQKLAVNEDQKKTQQQKVAERDQANYDALNVHDDQFDLSDAALSISIALLAITSLSQKWWLFWIVTIPTTIGIVMGLAGLLSWSLHPDFLIKPLTQNSQPITWRIAIQKVLCKEL